MVEVLVRRAQAIAFRPWHGVGFVPDQIVAEYPAKVLHGDSETGGDQQQILFLANTAERCLSAVTILAAQALPAVFPNASPAREEGIPEIDPHGPGWFQSGAGFMNDFAQVLHEPFGIGLKAEETTPAAIPVVTGTAWADLSHVLDIVEKLPVVIQPVVAVAPVGRAGDDQVDRRWRYVVE